MTFIRKIGTHNCFAFSSKQLASNWMKQVGGSFELLEDQPLDTEILFVE